MPKALSHKRSWWRQGKAPQRLPHCRRRRRCLPPAACEARRQVLASLPRLLQVYTVSGGKNIPAWLSDKKKKALRKDEEYRRRIELIQV